MKHVEVVAAVMVRDGRIFCARRKDAGEQAGKWEFPGGKLEAGETRAEALVRELDEELGARVEPGDFLMTVEHDYPSFSLTMHAYLATLAEGPLELREHSDARWLPPGELGALDWSDADKPIVELLRRGGKA